MKRLLIAVLIGMPLTLHAAGKTRFSLGAYFSSGDYGTTATTDIQSLSLGARYKTGPWTFKLSIPWLRIEGVANVLPGGQVTSGPATTRNREGLGDTVVSVARRLFYDAGHRVGMSLKGKLKLPTADKDQGLGTGELDGTIELAPYALIGQTVLFGSVGFKKYGDTPTTDYNDVWQGRIGFMHPVAERQAAGLSAGYRQRNRDGRDDKLDLMAFHTLKWKPGWKLQSYLIKGFSDATADLAGGVSLMREY